MEIFKTYVLALFVALCSGALTIYITLRFDIDSELLSWGLFFFLSAAFVFIGNKIVIAFLGPCPLDLNIENRHKIELMNITKRHVYGMIYFDSGKQVTQFSVPPYGRYKLPTFNHNEAKVTITEYPGAICIHSLDSEEPSGSYCGPFRL